MRAIISNHAVLMATALMLGLCACTNQIISGVGSGSGGGGSSAVSSTAAGQGGSTASGGMTGPGVSCSLAPPMTVPTGSYYCGANASAGSGQPASCQADICEPSGQHLVAECTADGCSCKLDNQVYCECTFQAPAEGCDGSQTGCCPAPWQNP